MQALKIIADKTEEHIPVVFCGSYSDYARALNFKEMWALAARLGLVNGALSRPGARRGHGCALRAVGRAGDADIFGPTNIPPLEAWHLGRPVITSDIRGLRDRPATPACWSIRARPRRLPTRCAALARRRALHDARRTRPQAPRLLPLGDLRRRRDRHRDRCLRAGTRRPNAAYPESEPDRQPAVALNAEPLC